MKVLGHPFTLVSLPRDAARWSFEEGQPSFHNGWRQIKVDPFPAYPHDADVVSAAATSVATAFPPGYPMTLFLAELEAVDRANGHSDRVKKWDHEKKGYADEISGVIFLSGKRIQPHPAVTRYLVAHEWGHHVEWWLEAARGLKEGEMIREYKVLRGLKEQVGTGGVWHAAAEEVFACDFRLIVAGVEPEFWPHRGVPRPEQLPEIRAWWAAAVAEWFTTMRAKEEGTT